MIDVEEESPIIEMETEVEKVKVDLTEEELTKRRKYLAELKTFLGEQQEKISLTLEQLCWTPEHFIKPQNKVTCPYDQGHVVPESSLEKHLESCKWLSKGVHREQLKEVLDEELRLEYNKTPVIKLDEGKLNGILWNKAVQSGQVYTGPRKLPVTAEEETMILTPDERLAVHDYIVSQAQSQGVMLNVEKDENLTTDWEKIIKKGVLESENSDKLLTPLEKMAALRDFKRRRQKYRAKNVHITKKSYTEIIREVISNQVEMWGAEETEEGGGAGREDEGVGGEGDVIDVDKMDRLSDRERDSGRGYSRDQSRDRHYGRVRDRDRDRESDRRRDRDKDRGSDRDSRGRDRDYDRDRGRDNRGRDDRDRGSNRNRDRDSDRHRERSQSYSRESRKNNRREMDSPGSWKRERSTDKESERERESSRETRRRSRSSDRRQPKREKRSGSKSMSRSLERERTPRKDERDDFSNKSDRPEESSSHKHKKSKKHKKHKTKHRKHKEKRKSSSSESDSEKG